MEGDLSTGISCYFFRVPNLCLLVLPNFQKAWGSRRSKAVCLRQGPEEDELRKDWGLLGICEYVKKKKVIQEIRKIHQIIPRLNI